VTFQDAGRAMVAAWRRANGHDLLMLASSPAYAAVLSVFPLLIAVIALLSRMVDPVEARETVLRAMGPYLPEQALALVRQTLEGALRARSTAGFVGIAGLLWGATAMTGSLRGALNRVIGAAPLPYWRRKLIDFVMVIAGGIFLSLSVLVSAVHAVVGTRAVPVVWFSRWLGDERVARLVATAGPVVFSTAAFYIAYRFLLNVRAGRRSLLWGTLVAMVLFEGLKRVFFWYLHTVARYPLVYGPLAGFIVFMIWIYLVAVVVLFGAEVLAVVQEMDVTERAHG
jgi:membrane protein